MLVLPSLATRIGLNQAIILQQLHWALGRRNAVEIDGVRWLKADLAWWEAQFPFWSEATIRRAIKDLTTAKLVKSKRGSEANVYAIDYALLDALQIEAATGHIDQFSRGRDDGGLKEKERKQQAAVAAGEGDKLFDVAPTEVPESELDAKVQIVWDYYFAKLGDRLSLKTLSDSRKKRIKAALKAAGEDTEALCRAIDGFIRYRSSKPGSMTLDDIFSSRPGGSSLTELIEFWISQADDSPSMSPTVPAAMRARVDRRRLQIVEALKLPDDSAAQERAREAVDWLRINANEGPVIEGQQVVRWERIP